MTQLFYDLNFLHDWFYVSGFDEKSGNGQASNYGRGGIEGLGVSSAHHPPAWLAGFTFC